MHWVELIQRLIWPILHILNVMKDIKLAYNTVL